MSRLLFVLKARGTPYVWDQSEINSDEYPPFSSGLFNSALQVVRMLQQAGVDAHIVQVIDNNDIDREVAKYKPTHVIIEALWVVPEKFQVLRQLHPTVEWIIRLHSEMPFLANEGIALYWIKRYVSQPQVSVAANTWQMVKDLRKIVDKCQQQKLLFLPNYYPTVQAFERLAFDRCSGTINVGCFGAVRPMKNQLAQAVAAIKLAKDLEVDLKFHINAGRVEQQGSNVLKNLRALFDGQPDAQLVEHGWYKHQDFLKVVASMDLGMQVSFSETFNIVTADFVNEAVPVVVSPEIDWLPWVCMAEPTDISQMVRRAKLVLLLEKFGLNRLNKRSLTQYSRQSRRVWLNRFECR